MSMEQLRRLLLALLNPILNMFETRRLKSPFREGAQARANCACKSAVDSTARIVQPASEWLIPWTEPASA